MNFNLAVRTCCLLALSMCVIVLMIQSYVTRYEGRLCSAFLKSSDEGFSRAKSRSWDYNWDLKFRNSSVRVRDRNFLLIRHGHHDDKSWRLSVKGRRQSNITAWRLRAMNHPYSRIISSTMKRAVETADIIQTFMPGVPLEVDPILEEGGPLPPNPKVKYWNLPPRTFHVDGPRLESAFRKYFHRADPETPSTSYEIIVAHGNILRYFVLRALQFQADAWMRMFIGHASVTFVNVKGDGTVSTLLFGDVGHLQQDDITY